MDQEFREIYREQIELYRAFYARPDPWFFGPRFINIRSLAIAAEAIDEASSILPEGLVLRPDARLFLLINLHQMVTIPLSDPRSPTKMSIEIEKGIKKDTKMILEEASEYSIKNDRKEIAASHVIRGLARVLEVLTLKAWRLWETSE